VVLGGAFAVLGPPDTGLEVLGFCGIGALSGALARSGWFLLLMPLVMWAGIRLGSADPPPGALDPFYGWDTLAVELAASFGNLAAALSREIVLWAGVKPLGPWPYWGIAAAAGIATAAAVAWG
jgi:hypothetical protein